MSDFVIVHYILYTLPHPYAPFKIPYNTYKDKWSINELVTMCVQEEERLLMEEGQMVNLTTSLKNKKNQVNENGKMSAKPVIKKESKCFFCKRRDT